MTRKKRRSVGAQPVDRAQGIHGNGGRKYTAAQGRALAAELQKHVGCRRPITVEELYEQTKVNGRAIRQFFSDYDGVWFLMGGGDEGYFICEWSDEAWGYTHRIQSQVKTMQDHLTRRASYAKTLPAMQQDLFEGQPDGDALHDS